jgi:argininosuccinate lyase
MADFAGAFSLVMSNLERLVTDLDQWTAQEFGFIEIADEYSGSSSIMPQKKNPYPFELIRGLSGESIGWMPAMLGLLKVAHTSSADPEFTPLHNGDLIEQASRQTIQMLDMLGDVLGTTKVYAETMRGHIDKAWCTASHLADVLSRKGNIPFRNAHRVVARLVRLAVQSGIQANQVEADLLETAADQVSVSIPKLTTEELRKLLTPEEFIATRVTSGSQNPDEIRRIIEIAKAKSQSQKSWLGDAENKVKEADARLKMAIDSVLSK